MLVKRSLTDIGFKQGEVEKDVILKAQELYDKSTYFFLTGGKGYVKTKFGDRTFFKIETEDGEQGVLFLPYSERRAKLAEYLRTHEEYVGPVKLIQISVGKGYPMWAFGDIEEIPPVEYSTEDFSEPENSTTVQAPLKIKRK